MCIRDRCKDNEFDKELGPFRRGVLQTAEDLGAGDDTRGEECRERAAISRARRALRPPRGAIEPTRSLGYGMSESGSSSVVSPSSAPEASNSDAGGSDAC